MWVIAACRAHALEAAAEEGMWGGRAREVGSIDPKTGRAHATPPLGASPL
jgi:hypothetical protein